MAAPGVDEFVRIETAMESAFTWDGRELVFRSNRAGVPQAWRVDVRGEGYAEARPLTDTGGVVYSARPQPDHPAVLYVADEGGDEQLQLHLLDLETGRSRALVAEPGVICNPGAWSRDGERLSYASNRRDRRFFDVWVRDIATGAERLVLEHDGMNAAGRFDLEGRGLLVTRPNLDAGAGDNDLWLVPLDGTGEPRLLTPHDGIAHWAGATFLRSGDVIAQSDEGRDFVGLQRIPRGGGAREYVLELDWDVEQFAVSRNAERLAVLANEDGYSVLRVWEIDAQGRPVARVPMPPIPRGVLSFLRWRPDGEALTFTLVSDAAPSDVWIAEVGAGEARRVSRSRAGAVPRNAFPEPETVRYPSFDGHRIPALFYVPPRREGPLPCAILVHGGPEGQSRPGLWGRSAALGWLLSRGEIALLVPNVRGSTGYGKEYEHADDVEKRMDSVRDLIAATDWLAETGVVDPDRIAVLGGSYGGFMVLAAITEAPERWAAAVDAFGIANFETFMERTGAWRRKHREAEYGSDPAFLRSISPIHQADRIATPLLVVQGDQDVRVPPEESEQIVESIRRRGGVVEYLLFEQEGHGIQKLPNRLEMERRIAAFLQTHLL